MPNLADEHLELEKIYWSACMAQDANELVDLSLRVALVLQERQRRETGDRAAGAAQYASGQEMFPACDEEREYWA
jgi:hypothetical protein